MHPGSRVEAGILGGASVAGAGSLVVAITTTSDTGPWLTFAGALIVAVVTAVFTRARQQAALDAEDRRHEASLRGERERLELQLDHNRRMTDTADLRRVLEEALRTVHERRDFVRAAREAVLAGRAEEPTAERTRMFLKAKQAVDAARIRLRVDDPLYEVIARLDTALESPAHAIKADQQQYGRADYEWRAAYHHAVREAQRRVGAYLDRPC